MQGFTRRRNKTWTAYYTVIDAASGKRRQLSKGGFRIKQDADAHLASVMPAVQSGTYRRDEALTVTELLTEWLAAKRSEGLKVGTLTMYSDVIDGWLVPNIGGLKVTQLSPKVAGELVAKLRSPTGSRLGRGALSNRSVQLAISVLKAATKWAWESGELSYSHHPHARLSR